MSALVWPLTGYAVTRGSAEHIAFGEEAAVDLAGAGVLGQPVRAMHDAIVTRAGTLGTCGLAIDYEFEHDGHFWSVRCCHHDSLAVAAGDHVVAGQVIGYVGYTGWVIPASPAGAHLHIALWIDGNRVWPEPWLAMIGGGVIIPPPGDGGGAPVAPDFRAAGPGDAAAGSGDLESEPAVGDGDMNDATRQAISDGLDVVWERSERIRAAAAGLTTESINDLVNELQTFGIVPVKVAAGLQEAG